MTWVRFSTFSIALTGQTAASSGYSVEPIATGMERAMYDSISNVAAIASSSVSGRFCSTLKATWNCVSCWR